MCGRKKSRAVELLLFAIIVIDLFADQDVQTERIDGIPWFFSVSNNEAVLVGCLQGQVGSGGDIREELVIPDVLAGRKVTTIRDDVFVRSFFWHGGTRKGVRCIAVPAGISNIGTKCFSYFPNLQQIEVDVSNGVYKSENGILYHKRQREAIVIPRGRLLEETYKCHGSTLLRWSRKSIGEVVVPQEIKCIGERAFENCKYIDGIVLPEGLQEVEEYAFNRCCHIRKMVLPSSVTNVSNGAFAQCSRLTYVEFPATLQALGDCAFIGCRNLKIVVFRGPPPFTSDILTAFSDTPKDVAVYCSMDDNRWVQCLYKWPGNKKDLIAE